ncbi:MAG: hypothetical protein AAFQ74_00070 [Cyanobacteria bacterium J06623_4]
MVLSLATAASAQPQVGTEAAPDVAPDIETESPSNAMPAEALCIPQLRREDLAQSPLPELVQLSLFLPPTQGELVTTEARLSRTNLSQPSLYWIQDQLNRRYELNNLVAQWQAYQTPTGFNYVDVIVNEGGWQQLGYFRRYAFVSQFGSAAQKDGYHLRVFHTGDAGNCRDARAADGLQTPRVVTLRGAYLCGIQQPDSTAAPLPCQTYVRQ